MQRSKQMMKEMDPEELEAFVGDLGLRPFRAKQVLRWIYDDLALSFQEMTDLSLRDRRLLSQRASLCGIRITKRQRSKDGTEKFLFELSDGHFIESVLMEEQKRRTLCISSQVGCAMGCLFCLTGKKGLRRDLRVHEMIDQWIVIQKLLGPERPIQNIVFMGMGEPLDNDQKVLKALRLMLSHECMDLSKRKVTLSTCGLVDKIDQLGRDGFEGNLAISLNATTDEVRDELMPINRRYPIHRLLKACRGFRLEPRRRITFEYLLAEGVNDSPKDARRLAALLRGIRCKVNLIPLNPHPETDLRPSPEKSVRAFQKILLAHQYTATIRRSKGADILAACGQLSPSKGATDPPAPCCGRLHSPLAKSEGLSKAPRSELTKDG